MQFFDPEADPRRFGIQLAESVIRELQQAGADEVVRVNLQGIRGAASSHFNIFLHQVGNYVGTDALSQRLQFDYASTPQRTMFERSLQAVIDALRASKI